MKKNYLFTLLICLGSITTSMGQTTQNGFVKEYKETLKKQPLGGVEMLITNAPSTVSDKKGNFALEFQTMRPGQKVNVRRIEKLGYEIFNKEALEQWNINPEEPFTIIMVRSDRFKKIRDNYSAVSSASYARQFEKEMKALEEERNAGKITKEQLRNEIIRLQEEYDRQLNNLDNYIDRFARIDLSELNKNEQEIIALVQAGEIETAIARYEEMDLIGKFEQLSKETKEIERAQAKLNKKLSQHDAAAKEILFQIQRQVYAYALLGGSQNYKKILALVDGIIHTASDAWMKLAFVHFLQNKDQIRLYESCNFDEIDDIHIELKFREGYGISLLLNGRIEDAQKQAEIVIERATQQNDIEFIIAGKSLLAATYSEDFQDDKAGVIYKELLGLIESADHSVDLAQQAKIYEMCAGYYQNIDINLFLKYNQNSYKLRKQIYESSPTLANERKYINSSIAYGLAMRVVGDYDGCIKAIEKVMPHFKELQAQYFSLKEIEYEISAYRTLAECYYYKHDYINCEQMFLAAIKLMEQQRAYISDAQVTSIYNNLGFLYYSLGNFEKSEQAYLSSLENAALLGNEVTFLTLNAIFRPQINIAVLYLDKNDYEKAKNYGYQGLNNCEILYMNYPEMFVSEYLLILKTLAKVEFQLGQYDQALALIEKAVPVNSQDPEINEIKKDISLRKQQQNETQISAE